MMRNSVKSLLLASSALLMPLSGQAQDCCFGEGEASPSCCTDCCGGKFSFEGDFLWWELRNDDYCGDIVYSESGSSSGSGDKTHRLVPKNEWAPGFRLGFYWEDCCQCFDLGVVWTHFNHNSSRGIHVEGSDGYFIDPVYGNEFDGIRGSHHFKSTLDYVDFDFSKDITWNCCFTFTPHVGVRGLWLNDKYRNGGHGTYYVESVATDAHLHSWEKHDSSAWGLEGGFWAQWNLGCNFSLFGHVGGALLAFDHNYKSRVHVENAETEATLASHHFKRHNKSTCPVFNYSLGVEYLWNVCDWDILLRASWEQLHIDYPYHQWQGLTLGAIVKF